MQSAAQSQRTHRRVQEATEEVEAHKLESIVTVITLAFMHCFTGVGTTERGTPCVG